MVCTRLSLIDEILSLKLFGNNPDFNLHNIWLPVLIACLLFAVFLGISEWTRPRQMSIWKLDLFGFLTCTFMTVATISTMLLVNLDGFDKMIPEPSFIYLTAILVLSSLLYAFSEIRSCQLEKFLKYQQNQSLTLKMKTFLIVVFLIFEILTVAFYTDKMRMSCVRQNVRRIMFLVMIAQMILLIFLGLEVGLFWLNWTSESFVLEDKTVLERSRGSGKIGGLATKRSKKMRELVERWI